MRILPVAFLLLLVTVFTACQKNTASKIPHITLIGSTPDTVMHVNLDTCLIYFSFSDGDGDIGNDSGLSAIYYKDSRFPNLDFVKAYFPQIDGSIEDPKKGLTGDCVFFPFPGPEPRGDSLHLKLGDTLQYEFYIKDRAGNESNHETTHSFVVKI